MCGFVARIGGPQGGVDLRKFLQDGLAAISHRGPDGQVQVVDRELAYAYVRLAITGPAEVKTDTFICREGRYHILFNGEIYNHVEIRKDLEKREWSFETQTDTEVLLKGYIEWGKEVLERINGMYAFAIYECSSRRLFCARDPFGQKPLFYFIKDGEIILSSEVKGITVFPGHKKTIDEGSIISYLRHEQFFNEQTIYRGIKQLPPGHYLFWEDGHLMEKDGLVGFRHTTHGENGERPAVVKEIEQTLLNAVGITCRSDVPVTFLLSGGVDSSLVLAMAKRCYPERNWEAFHLANESRSYNESSFAQAAANSLGVKLNIGHLSLKGLEELAVTLPTMLDFPQADPGILPKFQICKEIGRHYKVALTGDGADELFLGYLLFKAERLSKCFEVLPRPWIELIHRSCGILPVRHRYMSLDFLAKNFLRGFLGAPADRSLTWMESFSRSDLIHLLRRPPENLLTDLERWLHEFHVEGGKLGGLDRLAYQLQRSYLPHYILPNSDRAGMLNAVELRTPFLDNHLVRLLEGVSSREKMRGMDTKGLLKRIAESYLPKEIIHRKKIGFTAPLGELFRERMRPYLMKTFSEEKINDQGIFNYGHIKKILATHFEGRANNYKQIWTLLSFQTWYDHNF